MSEFDPKAITDDLFRNLRLKGFELGIGELLAAREAIDGGFGNSLPELESTLKLLWNHSTDKYGQFQQSWEDVTSRLIKESKPKLPQSDDRSPRSEQLEQLENDRQESFIPPIKQEQDTPSPQIETLPIRAPYTPLLPIESENTEFQSSFPLTRRYMVYAWRSLRFLVADGKQDILDVATTVIKTAKQGFFLFPVYKRRLVNRAHLLLLVDRQGSMMPVHRFTEDLVETAQSESKIQRVDVYYFHNVPATSVYKDTYLTEQIALSEVMANCNSDTKILIVSDAGAARGFRHMERIQSTIKFWNSIKRSTNLIAWLNPIPQERWVGTSAKIIANILPMFPMDRDGLSRAIDVLQGKFLT